MALLLPLGYSDQPEDIWKGYNAKHVQQALASSAGLLTGIDRTQFLAELRKQRVQGATVPSKLCPILLTPILSSITWQPYQQHESF